MCLSNVYGAGNYEFLFFHERPDLIYKVNGMQVGIEITIAANEKEMRDIARKGQTSRKPITDNEVVHEMQKIIDGKITSGFCELPMNTEKWLIIYSNFFFVTQEGLLNSKGEVKKRDLDKVFIGAEADVLNGEKFKWISL